MSDETDSESDPVVNDLTLVHDEPQLLAALCVADVDGLEDYLYIEDEWDGDVFLRPEGVELLLGNLGTTLVYSFTIRQLHEFAEELGAVD